MSKVVSMDFATFLTLLVLASQYVWNNMLRAAYLSENGPERRKEYNIWTERLQWAVFAFLLAAVLLGVGSLFVSNDK